MRALVVLAVLGGCLAGSRPAVLPKLSELPAEREKRDAVLDSAAAEPGPEHSRKKLPGKLHKAETAAATVAAVIGSLFSTTKTVTIGTLVRVDEAELFAPAPKPKREASEPEAEPKQPPDEAPYDADELVPWIRLK